MKPLFLSIDHLNIHFPIIKGTLIRKKTGVIKAVDDVSLDIKKGEVFGLVGESGCGKTTLGRSIMQLEQTRSGSISLEGKELNRLTPKKLALLRPSFQMIFQDPFTSLNPRKTVFDILAEPLLYHRKSTQPDVFAAVVQKMLEVGLYEKDAKKYPHEFSGGQRQRIAIARSLVLEPYLIVADEPVSALDVSIQSQILNLLMTLKQKYDLTMIFISHDLSVIRHISDRTAVMYLGKIVELGPTQDVFQTPQHPYTRALLSAIPTLDPDKEKKRKRILLKGEPPSFMYLPEGCRFHTRCPDVMDVCVRKAPDFRPIDASRPGNHLAACHRLGCN